MSLEMYKSKESVQKGPKDWRQRHNRSVAYWNGIVQVKSVAGGDIE